MTREEEIFYALDSRQPQSWEQYEKDIIYLLARNEELQRRVDDLESALEAIKEEAAAFASDERDLGYIFIGIYTLATNVLDDKGQDDAGKES